MALQSHQIKSQIFGKHLKLKLILLVKCDLIRILYWPPKNKLKANLTYRLVLKACVRTGNCLANPHTKHFCIKLIKCNTSY